MKPEQIAKSSESSHQCALFAWAATEVRNGRSELRLLHHIPNGGTRGNDMVSRQIAGGKLKAEGVRSGVPDVCLPVARRGFHGLYIEMKAPQQKSEKDQFHGCSDTQLQWLADLEKEGYCTGVCYTWEEARNALIWYLEGDKG